MRQIRSHSWKEAGLRGSLLILLLLFGPGGCQLVGSSGGAPSPAPTSEPTRSLPQGAFRGFLEIEGGRINGMLTLTPRGGVDLDGFFEAPPDLLAMGRGGMRGEEFRMELSYEGACPGKMTLVGRWEEGPGTLSGAVRASDCTGRANGTFLFSPDLNSFFPDPSAHSSAG